MNLPVHSKATFSPKEGGGTKFVTWAIQSEKKEETSPTRRQCSELLRRKDAKLVSFRNEKLCGNNKFNLHPRLATSQAVIQMIILAIYRRSEMKSSSTDDWITSVSISHFSNWLPNFPLTGIDTDCNATSDAFLCNAFRSRSSSAVVETTSW